MSEHIWHVYPQNDLIAHETDGDDCACGPRTEPTPRDDGSMGWVIVHNSLDGRELTETEEEQTMETRKKPWWQPSPYYIHRAGDGFAVRRRDNGKLVALTASRKAARHTRRMLNRTLVVKR